MTNNEFPIPVAGTIGKHFALKLRAILPLIFS